MDKLHLWQEEASLSDGAITVSVIIEYPDHSRRSLWYRFPESLSSLITTSCDSFVIASIFTAMNQSANLVVHGQVSPSLLQNLTEFQAVWACWCPQRYKQIEISAEVEKEQSRVNQEKAIAAFSGGVDSCFTMLRHRRNLCGRRQHNIQAGLMVHGFDIPLTQQEVFDRAAEKSRQMLASLGVKLIPIATNFKQLGQNWEDSHGAALASCLMLFQGEYEVGLIPSTRPYQDLVFWGSNPITDSLLSSKNFEIAHDGAAFTRIEKMKLLATWSQALENLRVCWQGSEKDRNCGHCEKCIRTVLGFRALGVGLPKCFEQDVTQQQIRSLKKLNSGAVYNLELVLQSAREANLSEPWVTALEKCIISNRLSTSLKKALKDHLQKLTVGFIR